MLSATTDDPVDRAYQRESVEDVRRGFGTHWGLRWYCWINGHTDVPIYDGRKSWTQAGHGLGAVCRVCGRHEDA